MSRVYRLSIFTDRKVTQMSLSDFDELWMCCKVIKIRNPYIFFPNWTKNLTWAIHLPKSRNCANFYEVNVHQCNGDDTQWSSDESLTNRMWMSWSTASQILWVFWYRPYHAHPDTICSGHGKSDCVLSVDDPTNPTSIWFFNCFVVIKPLFIATRF